MTRKQRKERKSKIKTIIESFDMIGINKCKRDFKVYTDEQIDAIGERVYRYYWIDQFPFMNANKFINKHTIIEDAIGKI